MTTLYMMRTPTFIAYNQDKMAYDQDKIAYNQHNIVGY